MKSQLTIIFFLVCVFQGNSQTASTDLYANGTRIKILNGGDFFSDLANPKYEIPKINDTNGVRKHSIFSGAVWISAYDSKDSLHVAAVTYRQSGNDYYPGPSSNSPLSRKNHDKIYLVTLDEIVAHIDAIKFGGLPKITDNIRNWPGNGDTSLGEPWQLAPFVDINKNGKYEPTNGDYPHIKGDVAAYCIYNDNGPHNESKGLPLNFDIHQMFYQVGEGTQNGLFDETNLAYFKIVNRSLKTYKKIKFGIFVDFDLGNYSDDFIGSDSLNNMAFVYNGDDNDEGVSGYGLNPPSQNVMFLNKKIYAASYYNNSLDTVNGNPKTPAQYNNLLEGNLTNGSPVKDKISGQSKNTRFVFHGNPANSNQWSEISDGNKPGDRRILIVAEPFALATGESTCIDIAFVYGRYHLGGPLGSFSEMKKTALDVQYYYDQDFDNWKSYSCKDIVGLTNNLTKSQFGVYPNPSSGIFEIQGIQSDWDIQLFNSQGQGMNGFLGRDRMLDITQYPMGVYLLRINNRCVRLVKL